MARLIDADRLLRDPYFQEDRYPCSHLIRMAIGEQRTVDAVPVVRCKDCKHYTEKRNKAYDGHYCERIVEFVQPSDFCSYGEKRCEGNG